MQSNLKTEKRERNRERLPDWMKWLSNIKVEMIPMMYHTWLYVLKKFLVVAGGRVIIVSALSLSLRDKERLREIKIERARDRESLTIFAGSSLFKTSLIKCKIWRGILILLVTNIT